MRTTTASGNPACAACVRTPDIADWIWLEPSLFPPFLLWEDNKPQLLRTAPPHRADFIGRGDRALTTRHQRSARLTTSISSAILRRWSALSPELIACSTQWAT